MISSGRVIDIEPTWTGPINGRNEVPRREDPPGQ